MAKRFKDEAVLVIGLGRFGSALAETLERLGHDVLAVDGRPELVQEFAGRLTHVVQADATSLEAMRQVGAQDFSVAVVAIGTGVEASVLSTAVLADLKVPEIWAKAITASHGSILERIGATHVVFPERDAGTRVARLLTGDLMDFFEVDPGYAMAKIRAPKAVTGKAVRETGLHEEHGLTIVGLKRGGGTFSTVEKTTEIHAGDILIIAGATNRLEKFAGSTD